MATVVRHAPRRARAWLIGLAGSAVAAMAVVWFTHSTSPEPDPDRPAVPAGGQQVASVPVPQPAMEELAAQQEASAQALIQGEPVKPIEGPVTERPAYVSPMEWMVLKGAVAGKPDSQQELTRMVNFLRFNKQIEAWEALSRNTDATARRAALAEALLADLPQRVRHDDVAVNEARELQATLLMDAEPDAARRQARALAEARRLDEAAASSR